MPDSLQSIARMSCRPQETIIVAKRPHLQAVFMNVAGFDRSIYAE
jgi:hypothetical protein